MIRTMQSAVIATVLTVLLASTSLAAPAVPAWRMGIPWSTDTATVQFKKDSVEAQIADTGPLRSRGLGYRDALAPGAGMLFVYQEPDNLTFWMKGMRMCLDIIWIEEGEIKGAAESVCPEPGVADADLQRYASPEPVRYVLEVPAGWLAEHGYKVGDPVEIVMPGDEP